MAAEVVTRPAAPRAAIARPPSTYSSLPIAPPRPSPLTVPTGLGPAARARGGKPTLRGPKNPSHPPCSRAVRSSPPQPHETPLYETTNSTTGESAWNTDKYGPAPPPLGRGER